MTNKILLLLTFLIFLSYEKINAQSSEKQLELSGWKFATIPRPEDLSTEGGKIVYQIKLDSAGTIKEVVLIETSVSKKVERVYREATEKLTFIKIGDNPAPKESTGKLTYIIKVVGDDSNTKKKKKQKNR